MDLAQLEQFLFWCLMMNLLIYSVTALAVIFMRGFVCKVQYKIFQISDTESMVTLQRYLAAYKLLITVFVFVPWLAVLIIQ